jgi:hypothetical protein
MVKTEQLYNLIHSLSPNEKRYFSMFGPMAAKPQNFRKLFGAYAAESTYNIKAIKKNAGNNLMNFAYENGYMQKMLMKSLRNFHDESSDQITLLNMLINVELLFNKQQYNLCLEHITQGRQLASLSQHHQINLLFIQWEKRCMVRMGNYDYMENYVKKGLQEEKKLAEIQQNLAAYRALQMQMLAIGSRKGNISRNLDRKKLMALIRHPLLRSVNNAKSLQAKLIYYEILMSWHSHNYQLLEAYRCNARALKLLETTPGAIEQNRQTYFSFLANMFNKAVSVDKTDEAIVLVDKLEKFMKASEGLLPYSQFREMRTFFIERKLLMFAYSSNYTAAIEFAESVLREIETPKTGLRQANLIVFYYFLSISCFFNHQYEKALLHLRKILDAYDDKIRLDYIFLSHLLHFLVHYKLKNGELLPYLLKSIQRFSQSRDLKSEVTQLILKFFNALIPTYGNPKLARVVINEYYGLLQPYRSNINKNAVIENLELLKWMEEELK